MTKPILVAAGLVAALAAGAAGSFAQSQEPAGSGAQSPGHRRQGPGPRMDFGLRGVELTEAQREQVRAIMESNRDELRTATTALRDAHRALAEASRGTSIDEAAIRARSTAVATAMADEAILRAKIRAEVHNLLTAEQQQQLKEREAAMQKRMQERQERQKQGGRQRPPQ
jgi:protein CpxP